MNLINQISEAFADRVRPSSVTNPLHPPTTEYTDAEFFQGRDWRTLTCIELSEHSDAVYGFSPEAFCYYLPGIFCAGIGENRPDLLLNNALISSLDRSNMPSSWDIFFTERWPRLSMEECQATQYWILWLSEVEPPIFFDNSLSRSFDTITLLINRNIAVPLAMR